MAEREIRRIGVLTGGGDCPGLNAVIRGVVKAGTLGYGLECVGIEDGYLGLIENRMHVMDPGAKVWDARIVQDPEGRGVGVRVWMPGEAGTLVLGSKPPGIKEDGDGTSLLVTRTAPATTFVAVHEPFTKAAPAYLPIRQVGPCALNLGGWSVERLGVHCAGSNRDRVGQVLLPDPMSFFSGQGVKARCAMKMLPNAQVPGDGLLQGGSPQR